ncbi:MDR family MFS transporter [Aspergillus novofumigatus IBT 16806]|uniref:Putative MFS drug transporter n=1 Tax=Aspergillus novofumigatus (strain IBT 16806) TaxID=1392255 RepID=A0A2I1CNZ6_ASPN1|nr:putative MFS drug transporter [Aspergillus novofumigatus IBT 16806]PKX99342.1 putative MFS drug transporter [Aspergillus novofumigatus IBT 16806]
MSSPVCSAAGSATVRNQSEDDVESTLSALYEERPLLDSTDEIWAPPKGFLWVQIAIMSNVFLSGFDGTITASTYAVISSDFNAANTASWLTTSYLITSTAFQPLYGRFSDIFGRRVSFFTATITFVIGCLGCGVARDIVFLNTMRALTGIGGGGLMTVATIINSDLIPFRRRGMYQALQNGMHGFGSICGASFGGSIVDTVGWRWCFLVQVPVGLFALVTGHLVLHIPRHSRAFGQGQSFRAILRHVDLSGALLLILGLSSQLVGLSLGGNELPWSSMWVILSLVASLLLLGLFMVVEAKTLAVPLIPSRMLRGLMPVSTQIANVCVGMAAYAFLFTLPLLFQVILQDTPTKAGARLAIPSLAAPIGSLISGVVMSRWGRLAYLVRAGCLLMCVGNLLVMSFQFHDAGWKYITYVIPASLGQGIVYPGILFTFLAAFDHTDHAVSASTVYLIRSLGTVWGVAITSAIIQNTLHSGLSKALSGIPDKWKVTSLKWSFSIIEQIRHSVSAIQDLPPDIQMAARLVYYRGIRLSFAASAGFAFIATIAALFSKGKGLHRGSSA